MPPVVYTFSSEEQFIIAPFSRFAALNFLALNAILAGQSTEDGHAILRANPIICLYETVEHLAYLWHYYRTQDWRPNLSPKEEAIAFLKELALLQRCMPLVMARSIGLGFGLMGTIIYSVFSFWQPVPWTVLFCWLYIACGSITVVLPPPALKKLREAATEADAKRIRQQAAVTRALIVHLIACALIPHKLSWPLVLIGGFLAVAAALGFHHALELDNARTTAQPVHLIVLVLGGMIYNIFFLVAVLTLASPTHKNETGYAVWAMAMLEAVMMAIPVVRGTDSVVHAGFFAAGLWCLGLVVFGIFNDLPCNEAGNCSG
jgi:hypothetical protein